MKEMVGGCCVCSDERGWPDNPLVYCDGNGCTVAVHQACYGIVTVPTGPWYCRKCESPETKGKVRCELCPSKSGALKRADSGGWAHVVCALYIPEVRFGNVTSMEPIVLRLIPPERYNKTCYICQETGKNNRAAAGACMQCNKSGCKQQFHVTCAQSLGLLCEEAGNYLDNVKYCGYCQHHYSKLKKGGNVKTIPPYKPVLHDGSSDSSEQADHSPSATPTHSKTKLGARKSGQSVATSGKTTPAPSKPATALDKSRKSSPARRESVKSPTPVGTGVISSVGTAVPSVQSPLPPPPPAALPPPNTPESVITTAETDLKQTKKRKAIAAAAAAENAAATPVQETPAPPTWDSATPEQPPDTPDKAVKKAKTEAVDGASPSMQPLSAPSPGPSSLPSPRPVSSPMPGPSGVLPAPNIRSPSQHQMKCGSPASLPVSVPLPAGPLPPSMTSPANASNTQVSADSAQINYLQHQKQTAVDPSRAWPGINVNFEPQQQDLSKQGCGVVKEVARNKKRGGGMPTSVVSLAGGRDFDRLRPAPLYHETIKDSPPHSPGSDKPLKPKMENKSGPSCSAPHMLGNELNPESMAAARLQEQLTAELAAHATAASASATASGHQLIPPPLINKGAGASTRSSGAQSLDQLLERQWEQGSQFLMEQAQHFDIASLLSCLHQLRTENVRLEEHVGSLLQRRDHLLAVNARLAIPLTTHHLAGPAEPRACPRENGARPPPPNARADLPDHKHQLMVREVQQKPS